MEPAQRAGRSRVSRRDRQDGAEDSLAQLLVRLAVPAFLRRQSSDERNRKALLSLRPGQADHEPTPTSRRSESSLTGS